MYERTKGIPYKDSWAAKSKAYAIARGLEMDREDAIEAARLKRNAKRREAYAKRKAEMEAVSTKVRAARRLFTDADERGL